MIVSRSGVASPQNPAPRPSPVFPSATAAVGGESFSPKDVATAKWGVSAGNNTAPHFVFASPKTAVAPLKTVFASATTVFAPPKMVFASLKTVFAPPTTVFAHPKTAVASLKMVFAPSKTVFAPPFSPAIRQFASKTAQSAKN